MYENIYYSPEKFGLETVGEIHWTDEPYQFDFTVVWKAGKGKYYIASDSGCSCPSPFEDYNSVESLDGPMTKKELESRLKFLVNDGGPWHDYGLAKAELLKEVREILSRA